MPTRAHFYAPIQNNAGDIQANSTVRVLQPETTTLVSDPIYPDNDTPTVMSNPFICDTGVISFYMDQPQRVRLGITMPGQPEVFIDDLDVLALSAEGGADSSHAGLGTNSTSVGAGAVSAGSGASAFGNSASAGGAESVAIGHAANASGTNATVVGSTAAGSNVGSIALGEAAQSTGSNAIAIGIASAASGSNSMAAGDNSGATGDQATALGTSASAARVHSTALGAGAITTEDNQVMLGTAADNVRIPHMLSIAGANGTVYDLFIDNAGEIQSRYHIPPTATALLSGDDSTFETGVGGWTAVSGCTIASASTYHLVGANAMQMTLTAAPTGPSPETNPSARSTKVPAIAGHVYIARACGFVHAGDGSSYYTVAWADFYDASDALLGSVRGLPRAIVLVDGSADYWSITDVYAVAPLNTATVALRLGLPYSGDLTATTGDVYYFDNAQIYDLASTT